jgi:RNA methyltransferase, TrmH family
VITSPHNARVAAARKLRQRKQRAAADAFLVEGPHATGQALTAGTFAVRELFVTAGAAERERDLLRTAAAADVPVCLVTDQVLETLADTVTPQGVVAVVRTPRTSLDDVLRRRPRHVVVLVEAADPGNVGTVIRTADAAGADLVMLTSDSTDPYGGKCVRASAGSLFHLPVVTGIGLALAVERLKGAGLQVLATTTDGTDLDEVGDLARPTAWLFGNEAHGLPAEAVALADRTVRVPIHGRAESLNLAAAAAVCLYATASAQRR